MEATLLVAGVVMAFTPDGPSDRRQRARRRQAGRFLAVNELSRRPQYRTQRPWGDSELFAEGQWQAIRVHLERQGWCQSQIDLVHDQLRQGWPLVTAKLHATRLSGHCPIKAQSDH